MEPSKGTRNQYYFCVYCDAYILKKSGNHHKFLLDHFLKNIFSQKTLTLLRKVASKFFEATEKLENSNNKFNIRLSKTEPL